jgi:helix-turn-helix protein
VSTDERARIRALASEGLSVRAIGRELGLSKSAVHRVLMAPDPQDPPDYEDPDYDGDEDPWEPGENETEALFDTDEERWPVEPLTFVGYERQWFSRGKGNGGYWGDLERWMDAEGRHIPGDEPTSAELELWRYANHVACELGDRERADALEADWQRQRDEYAARVRARR